ncbi:flavin reductase family protein [Nocardioides panacisoli]|uniref:flavin reductase family protein n=1 Tax=Nocardioides panacisoli TaxID=627624 RepID=UPI001C62547A|nr:flavin reductase family protein [Nocardioides panacisoli]QYJ03641.1 flavin reductase family protein [Nocardioides panacisoli]
MVRHRTVFRTDDAEVNAYKLLTAVVVPRPIAWVSTLSADGVGNLAPHSFYTVASARPPIVQFTSVGHKDSLRNARETGEFVISLANRALMDQVNATSAPYDAEVDEASTVGVAMEASETVAPPRVAGSPASIECRLHSTVDLGESVVVLGDVLAVTVASEALVDGHPAMEHLEPVSRLGRNQWGLPPEVVAVDRPTEVPRGDRPR